MPQPDPIPPPPRFMGRTGDVNAFFGLMLDNFANLLAVGLLTTVFEFPTNFALRR